MLFKPVNPCASRGALVAGFGHYDNGYIHNPGAGRESEEMMNNLKRFTTAFIEALYFTETGDDGQPSADAEISPESMRDIEAHCRSFWSKFGPYIESEITRDFFESSNRSIVEAAGHDFWFTANGHGVGFWEPGEWPECYQDMLTAAAKSYGPFDVYVGDDGLICLY